MSTKKKKNNKNEVNEPIEHYNQPLNFEKVWLMFQETSKKFEETDKRFEETDKQFKETDKRLDKKFQETNKQFKETDKKILETDKRLDKKFLETDKKSKELSNLFTTQWGKLIESLVEGDLIRLLNEKGIEVQQTFQRVSGTYQGDPYEFDIIASNGEEVVIVEVKTTLRVEDVKKFLRKLAKFKTWMPVYKEKTVYGAVAFLTSSSASHTMAENKGLFVIKATGKSSSIVNKKGFMPKAF